MVQASDLESRPGCFTSTCDTPLPCSKGASPSPSMAGLVSNTSQQTLHTGAPLQGSTSTAIPATSQIDPLHCRASLGAWGSHTCLVFPSGEERVHLESILTPPNKEVINEVGESQPFHLCLMAAASASNVFWNSSKVFL